MKNVLSLDISTSATGYSLWKDGKLEQSGAIESPTEEFPDIMDKLDFVVKELQERISKYQIEPEVIAVESALLKISGGKTTANTMSKLIAFNFGLTYTVSRAYKAKVEFFDVRAARTSCGIVIPKTLVKKDKKRETKKAVIEHWKLKYPSLAWDKKKTGNYKDWVGDMADSITIGTAYNLKK